MSASPAWPAVITTAMVMIVHGEIDRRGSAGHRRTIRIAILIAVGGTEVPYRADRPKRCDGQGCRAIRPVHKSPSLTVAESWLSARVSTVALTVPRNHVFPGTGDVVGLTTGSVGVDGNGVRAYSLTTGGI